MYPAHIANGLIAGGPQLGAGAAAGTGLVIAGAGVGAATLAAGGIGAVEVGLAALLTLFGIGPSTALAVALLDRVISYWGLIAAGLPTYLFSKRAR